MFRERYRHMSRQIAPDDALLRRTLQTAQVQENRKQKPARRILRPMAAMLAACLCLAIAMPALAANVEPVYEILYAVSPATAQFFMPVNKFCEDNGIRMEVESAYFHGDTAEIYVTMCDTEGKGRIDETTDLFDSYDINRPFDSACGCSFVDYNADTQTARFYITIQTMNGEPIDGGKVTFSVREFLSGKHEYEDVEIPGALDTAAEHARTRTVEIDGGGYPDGWTEEEAEEKLSGGQEVLATGEPYSTFPIDGIDLTGTGYIDGQLHIQLAMRNVRETDNHGFIWLEGADGTRVEELYVVMFDEDTTGYYEYIFDVPVDELAAYSLHGDFVTCDTGLTKGNWRVTFPLEQAE